jgi:hypothetical protein|tara:strand:+ start:195 stop:506 length:312 start_codon:yes stop_codon:yes gene_type:complete
MLVTKRDFRSALERIAAVEKAQDSLERAPKLLRNEWEDTLDRMNRIMGRLNARIRTQKRLDEEDQEPETVEKAPEAPSQPLLPTGTHSTLKAMRGRIHGVLPR